MRESLTERLAARWNVRCRLENGEVAALGLVVAFVLIVLARPIFADLLSSDRPKWGWEQVGGWFDWASGWAASTIFCLGIVAIGWWQTPERGEESKTAIGDEEIHRRRSRLILLAGATISLITGAAAITECVYQIHVYGWGFGSPIVAYALSSLVIAASAFVIARRILREPNGSIELERTQDSEQP